MKNLFIITILAITLVSCKKENFEPKQQTAELISPTQMTVDSLATSRFNAEKNTNIIDIYFRVQGDEPDLSGVMKIWFGDSLAYTLDISTINFVPYTDNGANEKVGHIQFTCTNAQLVSANRWFHFRADFDNEVSWLYNVNKFNDKMTYMNENLLFPEPSFKIESNFTVLLNSFWIKPPVIIRQPQPRTELPVYQ